MFTRVDFWIKLVSFVPNCLSVSKYWRAAIVIFYVVPVFRVSWILIFLLFSKYASVLCRDHTSKVLSIIVQAEAKGCCGGRSVFALPT